MRFQSTTAVAALFAITSSNVALAEDEHDVYVTYASIGYYTGARSASYMSAHKTGLADYNADIASYTSSLATVPAYKAWASNTAVQAKFESIKSMAPPFGTASPSEIHDAVVAASIPADIKDFMTSSAAVAISLYNKHSLFEFNAPSTIWSTSYYTQYYPRSLPTATGTAGASPSDVDPSDIDPLDIDWPGFMSEMTQYYGEVLEDKAVEAIKLDEKMNSKMMEVIPFVTYGAPPKSIEAAIKSMPSEIKSMISSVVNSECSIAAKYGLMPSDPCPGATGTASTASTSQSVETTPTSTNGPTSTYDSDEPTSTKDADAEDTYDFGDEKDVDSSASTMEMSLLAGLLMGLVGIMVAL